MNLQAPHGCVLQIGAVGLPPTTVDSSTWYDIWAAVVAMKGMCARFNRDSRMVAVGKLHGPQSGLLTDIGYKETMD